MTDWRTVLLVAAFIPVVAAGDIYRHVDEDGNVSYSDEPRNGGESVDVEDSGSSVDFRTPDMPEPVSNQDDPEADNESPFPDLRIVKPEEEGTVRDNQGLVDVRAATDNQLPRGHRFEFLLDGSVEGDPTPAPKTELTGVNRGEHTIQVRIIDAEGEPVAESEAVTFYMHQASRLIGGDRARPGSDGSGDAGGINPTPDQGNPALPGD
ncbi:MAG: DUF4124 domain-containing protein [Ectothiorhodospiraceae bacterium]